MKISLQNESTKRIFWKHEGFVTHDTKRIRIRQSRNETNLFGVRIRDYNTKRIHGFAKRIHVFTNLLYESRILSASMWQTQNSESLYFWIKERRLKNGLIGQLGLAWLVIHFFKNKTSYIFRTFIIQLDNLKGLQQLLTSKLFREI